MMFETGKWYTATSTISIFYLLDTPTAQARFATEGCLWAEWFFAAVAATTAAIVCNPIGLDFIRIDTIQTDHAFRTRYRFARRQWRRFACMRHGTRVLQFRANATIDHCCWCSSLWFRWGPDGQCLMIILVGRRLRCRRSHHHDALSCTIANTYNHAYNVCIYVLCENCVIIYYLLPTRNDYFVVAFSTPCCVHVHEIHTGWYAL